MKITGGNIGSPPMRVSVVSQAQWHACKRVHVDADAPRSARTGGSRVTLAGIFSLRKFSFKHFISRKDE